MVKKKRAIPDEAAEVGRLVGSLERTGYKEMIDEIRAMAKAEGKNVTDKLAEIIKAGIGYEKYKDLKLADAMLVLDFIERTFNNLLYPIMYTVSQVALEAEIQKLKSLAGAMGFVPREEAEKIAAERARQILEQLAMQQERGTEKEDMQQEREGVLSEFIRTLSRRVAERLGEEIARKIAQGESLDGLMDGLRAIAEDAVKEALMEEFIEGEGNDEGSRE